MFQKRSKSLSREKITCCGKLGAGWFPLSPYKVVFHSVRILGMFPFEIDDKSDKVKTSLFWLIYSLLVITFLAIVMVFCSVTIFLSVVVRPNVLTVSSAVAALRLNLAWLSCVFCLYHRKHFFNGAKRMSIFSYRNSWQGFLFVFPCYTSVTMFLLNILLDKNKMHRSSSDFYLFFWQHVSPTVIQSHALVGFIIFVFSARDKFLAIAKEVPIDQQYPANFYSKFHSDNVIFRLQKVRLEYAALLKTCKAYEEAFWFPVLGFVAALFLHSTSSLYYIITNNSSLNVGLSRISDVAFNLFQLSTLFGSCARASKAVSSILF